MSTKESSVSVPVVHGTSDISSQNSLTTDGHSAWRLFGSRMPKSEVMFATQTFMLYIIIIVCLVNLSIGKDPRDLWTALLSSSIGYMLPQPSLKREKIRL